MAHNDLVFQDLLSEMLPALLQLTALACRKTRLKEIKPRLVDAQSSVLCAGVCSEPAAPLFLIFTSAPELCVGGTHSVVEKEALHVAIACSESSEQTEP